MKVASIFGSYAESVNLQMLINSALSQFAPTWYQQYFDFGPQQNTLSYVTVIGRTRIEAAASVIARGSQAPLRSRAGLEKLNGSIPPISQKFNLDEELFRSYLTIQALPVSEETKKNQAIELLFGDVKKTGDALHKRLDVMCLEGLSTGYISLDVNNNPDGVVLANPIDLLHSNSNKANATATWAVPASSKPITDIENLKAVAGARGITFEKMLMSEAVWQNFRQSTEVKDYFAAQLGKVNNKILVTLQNANDFLTAQRLPYIEIVEEIVGIEKDGVINTIKPFSQTNVVFVPAGRLGTIHNSIAVEEMRPVAGVGYAKFRGGLISKWSENEPWAEWTKGEINAFPGFDSMDGIFLLSSTAAFSL